MFPDSDIARSFKMGRDKMAYTVVHGLAPFFKKRLLCQIAECSELAVCFDESLNSEVQKGQMDILARFWDSDKQQMTTRYLSSVFLQRASSKDLADAFKAGLDSIALAKVIQISMDGPSVNHKFYRYLKTELEISPDDPKLIDTGTCSLHVINGAFQTGHKAAGWNINGFLRSLFHMFKDCPARRAQYSEITSSDLFPLKFCAVRWTENCRVTTRALQMLPFLRKWIKDVKPRPSSQLFDSISTSLADPLLEAKLQFSKSVSALLEPFLVEFQTEQPMLPLLFERLEQTIRSVMNRFVKGDAMTQASTAAKLIGINLAADSESLRAKCDVGFGASKCLGSGVNITPLRKLGFYNDCRTFYRRMTEKAIERCPLSYKFVRAVSSLSPLLMKHKGGVAEKRFQMLLELLVSSNRLCPENADKAKEQFSTFLRDPRAMDAFARFDYNRQRLDDLFVEVLQGCEQMDRLWAVVQKVLIVSHGNASVEAGFSVNSDFLIENPRHESLVGLRVVYDAIKSAGGPLVVTLNSELMESVKWARKRYREALECRRTQSHDEIIQREKAKRQAKEQLMELQAKKQALQTDTKDQEAALLRQIAQLQKTLDI